MAENFTIGSYLTFLDSELDQVINEARQNFTGLSEDQFNWKANGKEWSVAQCLEHMRMNGISFIPVFDKVLREEHSSEEYLNLPYSNGFLGKRAIRIIGPENTRKFKTTKKFSPQLSNYTLTALEDFISLQEVLKDYVSKSSSYNIKKIKVAMPAFEIFRLSMGDMLNFIIAHEKRHIKQATLIMKMTGFPS